MSEYHSQALPTGTHLGEYRIERVLGHGGFGITYLAQDVNLQTPVAIKEFLPAETAYRDNDSKVRALSSGHQEFFEWGLERFIDEARVLARFRHPSIIQVYRFLQENETAYLVTEYCEGEPLDRLLEREGRLDEARVQALINPLLDALEQLHAQDVIHRDIKPGNIYLRTDGTPVLLDFGSARQAFGARSRSMTSVVSAGYAPIEQYSSRGKQGPWTDIYGLGATLYQCVTGQTPPEASERIVEDELVPVIDVAGESHPRSLLESIDAALAVRPETRLQSAEEWRRLLGADPGEVRADEPPAMNSTSTVAEKVAHQSTSTGSSMDPQQEGVRTQQPASVPPHSKINEPQKKRANRKVTHRLVWVFGTFLVLIAAVPMSFHYRDKGAEDYIGHGERYLDNGDGTVTDRETGLMWMRCALGQTWRDGTCQGDADTLDWDEAMEKEGHRFAGYDDWRLPEIEELKALVFCSSGEPSYRGLSHDAGESAGESCKGDYDSPTIDEVAFPNTSSSNFWSAALSARHSDGALRVIFSNGSDFWYHSSAKYRVRLVRGGQ